jgi:uncharacterized protein (DUF849 family)
MVAAARIERIKACLNGGRDPREHPAIPVTPAELAAAAAAAVAAGAEAVHVHPRAADGRESLLAADVGAAVAAVRTACPDTPVGVTTGLWAAGDPQTRQQLVAEWAGLDSRARPDFASVNISEDGWPELAATLATGRIGPEAGVWSVADAAALAAGGPPGGWLRILVEVPGVRAADAVAAASEILDRLPPAITAPVLLHGEDDSCWPLIAHAGRLGLPTRIGLEDVTSGPSGDPVTGNADLVGRALARWLQCSGAEPGS